MWFSRDQQAQVQSAPLCVASWWCLLRCMVAFDLVVGQRACKARFAGCMVDIDVAVGAV
jgi:hypothetical protein